MSIEEDFNKILETAHIYDWKPDIQIAKEIYFKFPDSYSVLTPFFYSYLEETIRSTTSEYGKEIYNKDGTLKWRKTGIPLIELAINENIKNEEYVKLLKDLKTYFQPSASTDHGNNRASTIHGYMHSIFWTKENFEKLIHDIARLSKYANY